MVPPSNPQADPPREQYDFGLESSFYDRTLDGMTNPLVVVDAQGIVQYGNFAALALTGWTFEEGVGTHILEFVHPDDHQWIAETFLTLVGMDEGSTMLGSTIWNAIRFRLVRKDGTIVPVEVTGKVAIADPAVGGVALSIRDVRLEATAQRILRGIATGDDVAAMMSELTDAISLPPLSLEAAAFRSTGRHDVTLVHSTDPTLAGISLADDALGAAVPTLGAVTRMPAGEVPTIGPSLTAAGFEEFLHLGVTAPDSDVTFRIVAASPIHIGPTLGSIQRMEWAQELANIILLRDHSNRLMNRAATIDPLTGLRNRRGLTSYLDELPDDTDCAVLFVDLDDFKAVNDAYGHQVGDRTLSVVADRLRRAVRLDDLICRLGGDEFAVVLADLYPTGPTGAERVADRIVSSLNAPIVVGERSLELSASVGIAIGRTPLLVDDLFESADSAMYEAKRSGGGRYAVDSPH